MASKKPTPMMQQFNAMKEQYPDCILFFRLGDFYEMFGEDAKIGAKILDITLTARSKGVDAIPMCGIPYHSAEGYILKLTHAGQKVAICEQISDPTLPGIVKRDVVRVVTPGTNISDTYLAGKLSNHILAISQKKASLGLAYADISTGECFVDQVKISDLASILQKVQPTEVLLTDDLYEHPQVFQLCSYYELVVTKRPAVGDALTSLLKHLDVTRLEGFGIDHVEDKMIVQAAANLFEYLQHTQKQELSHLRQLRRMYSNKYLLLDATTIQNLELFVTQKDHSKQGALFSTINYTVTRSGGRLLARWLLHPLRSSTEIKTRQNQVTTFVRDEAHRVQLQSLLKQTYDLQRLVSRISLHQGTPRDLAAIRSTLQILPTIKASLEAVAPDYCTKLPLATDLLQLLEQALTEQPPATINDLGIIADNHNEQIDELRKLYAHSEQVLADFLAKEKEATGISNLKVGSNKVVGFYLEVSKGKLDLVPEHYIAKQTLTNCNRYITPELKAYEEKILAAEGQLHQLETQLCQELFQQTMKQQNDLQQIGHMIAELDCWLSLAELAARHRYVAPTITEDNLLEIKQGRHSVIERLLPSGKFVANDAAFNSNQRVVVLTGPNMGGKSTYLRQVALVVLLAHMGSYVPASAATIPLTDRIFTRVGASDNLSRGQSTFMVEMQELAAILNQATERSLLIIDEIGRGTSTYDGVSIAWATLEYIHNKIKGNTLFATHFHELIDVASALKHANNYSMAVHEEAKRITFLHQVQEGGMNDSYGIEVAKRAGIPEAVVTSAQEKLLTLEEGHLADRINATLASENNPQQLDFFAPAPRKPHPLIEELGSLNLNELTPLQALQKLAGWQEELG